MGQCLSLAVVLASVSRLEHILWFVGFRPCNETAVTNTTTYQSWIVGESFYDLCITLLTVFHTKRTHSDIIKSGCGFSTLFTARLSRYTSAYSLVILLEIESASLSKDGDEDVPRRLDAWPWPRGKSGPALGGTEYRLMPSACRLMLRAKLWNLQFQYLVSRAPMQRRSLVVV